MAETAQALPSDAQLFSDIFGASPIGIAIENFEGQPLFVNPALCSMLGFSQEEMCDKHCVQFSPPEDAEKDWALFQQLRAGSIDHYHLERRYFRRDGSLVWGRLSVSLLKGRPSPLVIALVENITDKKRAEEALRKGEERYRDLAAQNRTTHWEVDPQGLFTYVSQVSQTSWGYTPDELVGRMHFYHLHPEEGREAFKAAVFAVVEQKQPFQDVIHAVETKDGRVMWGSTNGIPLLNADGTLRGYSGSCADITERKRAEEALSNVNRRLIEAQEQERMRIARELHDDINQRLAMLAVELAQLQESPSEDRSRLQELHKQATEISNDVQAISHELHSSKLDYLGIVGAVKNFCKEFGESHKVEVDFQSHDAPADLPAEVSLSLFRVLQEALCNAVKHSGVKRMEVQLHEESDEIHLTIRDLGKGFDVEAAKKGQGLGLTSMQERVRAVNGKIAIESKPMGGTTVEVRVPLESHHRSQRAS